MKRAGYTLIEVMTAVVVMTIGSAGILAMQGATTRSNQDAYESGVAANFAATWLERLKRDARQWTETGNAALANTRYLNGTIATDRTAAGYVPPYFVPTPLLAGAVALESPGADYFGFDTVDPARIHYCVNVSLVLAHAYNPTGAPLNLAQDANAIQASVRVWWYRWGPDANRSAVTSGCLAGALTELQNADRRIRKQYYSTILGWRAPGWP
jgi:prepilin-type N-terminal cleavage/methylation domain-containing protein